MTTGKREEWEEVLKGEPFAGSAFTERHKQSVLQRVAGTKPIQGQSDVESPFTKSMEKLNLPGQRKSRKKGWVAGITAAAAAAGILLWSGQYMEPVVERLYPASALLLADDVNKELLTEPMKRTIAVTMKDYLGKQLEVTMVRDDTAFPNVSNTIYVQAGQKTDDDYAEFSLDAATGELQSWTLRGQMDVSKLEPRYLSQIPALLEDIGSDRTMKPLQADRSAHMSPSEDDRQPEVMTLVKLGNENGKVEGSIIWQQDEVIYVSGSIDLERAPKEAVDLAKQAVEAYSGYSALALTSIAYNKNMQDHWSKWDLTFGERYLVTLSDGKYGKDAEVSIYDMALHPAFNSDAREETKTDQGKQRLMDVPESKILKNAEPMIENVFQVSLEDYRFSKDSDDPGQGTFKLEQGNQVVDVLRISYDAEGRITSLSRSRE